MATRLHHWDKIEAAAAALIDAIRRAARDPAWGNGNIEVWSSVHDQVSARPRLTLKERDRLSGRFIGTESTKEQP